MSRGQDAAVHTLVHVSRSACSYLYIVLHRFPSVSRIVLVLEGLVRFLLRENRRYRTYVVRYIGRIILYHLSGHPSFTRRTAESNVGAVAASIDPRWEGGVGLHGRRVTSPLYLLAQVSSAVASFCHLCCDPSTPDIVGGRCWRGRRTPTSSWKI